MFVIHKSRNIQLVSEEREVIQSSNLVKVYHPIVTRIGIVGLKGDGQRMISPEPTKQRNKIH